MIGARQTDTYLQHLTTSLPSQIATPDGPLTAASIIGTIRHGLLPHITGGPAYKRPVDDNLQRALAAYRRGDAGDTLRWLHDAVAATIPAPTCDQLAAENARLRAALDTIRDITPYCDIPVASGLLRVVRLTDIQKALVLADQDAT